MISNERPSYFGNRTNGYPAKSQVSEDTLKTGAVQIERKEFVFSLKENPRGRFLRITEEVGGRRNTIIIPAPGLEDFKRLLDQMAATSEEAPHPVASEDAGPPPDPVPAPPRRSSRTSPFALRNLD